MKKIVLYKAIMSDVPRSEVFDDVYFSAKDGLAETRHVFLFLLGEFLSNYPAEINNEKYNMDVVDGVSLTLICGDVNDGLSKLNTQIDCWFLDGFKPSTNPDMWSCRISL